MLSHLIDSDLIWIHLDCFHFSDILNLTHCRVWIEMYNEYTVSIRQLVRGWIIGIDSASDAISSPAWVRRGTKFMSFFLVNSLKCIWKVHNNDHISWRFYYQVVLDLIIPEVTPRVFYSYKCCSNLIFYPCLSDKLEPNDFSSKKRKL